MVAIHPVNDDHAVVSVAFVLHLSSPIDAPTIQSLLSSRTRLVWTSELPAIGQDMVQVVSEDGSAFELPTLRFSVLRPNGTPTWFMHFNGMQLEVRCQLYTRWAAVRETAKQYLSAALEFIRAQKPDLSVQQVQLSVGDSFKADDGPYEVTELLIPGGPLGTVPFEHDQLWHVNFGWFDTEEQARTLHNVMVRSAGTAPQDSEAQPGAEAVGAPYTVAIVHMMQHAPKQALTAVDDMFAAFDDMHQRNKALLIRLLTEEVRDRIGLRA